MPNIEIASTDIQHDWKPAPGIHGVREQVAGDDHQDSRAPHAVKGRYVSHP